MSGTVAGNFDKYKALRGNGDAQATIVERNVLGRRRFPRSSKLRDLITRRELGTTHCVVGFDYIAMVGVDPPNLCRRVGSDPIQLQNERFGRA